MIPAFLKTTLLTAVIGLAALTPAWAHAFIDHASPAVGGAVKASPPEVRVWFTEALEAGFSRLQVFDATNREVDKKDARVDQKNPREISVSLPAALPAGTYRVVWRAVSVDTHVTQGDFTFRVEP